MSTIDGTTSTLPSSVRPSPLVAYVATIVGLDLVLHVIWDPAQTGTVAGVLGTFLPRGLILGLLLGAFLLPAATLTVHLAHRWHLTSKAARTALGMASWLAWYLATAGVIFLARTIGLWPEAFVALLVLVAGAGAAFGLFAISDPPRPPAMHVTVLGAAIAALILVGSIVTAGWWGSPA